MVSLSHNILLYCPHRLLNLSWLCVTETMERQTSGRGRLLYFHHLCSSTPGWPTCPKRSLLKASFRCGLLRCFQIVAPLSHHSWYFSLRKCIIPVGLEALFCNQSRENFRALIVLNISKAEEIAEVWSLESCVVKQVIEVSAPN